MRHSSAKDHAPSYIWPLSTALLNALISSEYLSLASPHWKKASIRGWSIHCIPYRCLLHVFFQVALLFCKVCFTQVKRNAATTEGNIIVGIKNWIREKNENLLGIFQDLKRNHIKHQKHPFMNYWKMLWHFCDGGDESTKIEQREKGFSVQKCLFLGWEVRNGGSVTARAQDSH